MTNPPDDPASGRTSGHRPDRPDRLRQDDRRRLARRPGRGRHRRRRRRPRVTAPGQPAHDAILSLFGDGVRATDATLDRAALGAGRLPRPGRPRPARGDRPSGRPAADPRARSPRPTTAGAPAVVIEAIKLVEGGLSQICDEVWLVTCDPVVQRERVVGRGATRADDATPRMAAQAGIVGAAPAGRDARHRHVRPGGRRPRAGRGGLGAARRLSGERRRAAHRLTAPARSRQFVQLQDVRAQVARAGVVRAGRHRQPGAREGAQEVAVDVLVRAAASRC